MYIIYGFSIDFFRGMCYNGNVSSLLKKEVIKMTGAEAFDFAKAEIETFGFPVRKVKLELPKKAPDGTFYAFFFNPSTGEALCRAYLYDRGEQKTVSFVEIVNFEILKKENPSLVTTFLENGKFLYRGSKIKKINQQSGNIISLFPKNKLEAVPV